MKQKYIRLLAVLLCAGVLLRALPVTVWAEEAESIEPETLSTEVPTEEPTEPVAGEPSEVQEEETAEEEPTEEAQPAAPTEAPEGSGTETEMGQEDDLTAGTSLLRNGSFEKGTAYNGTPNSAYAEGWLTTDQMIERTNNYSVYGVSQRDGEWIVELNGNSDVETKLYQEVETTPGDVLRWYIDHAQRSGYPEKTMTVNLGTALDNYTYTSQPIGAAGTAWETFTDLYRVPEEQTSTTFVLHSKDRSGAGNMIDNARLEVAFRVLSLYCEGTTVGINYYSTTDELPYCTYRTALTEDSQPVSLEKTTLAEYTYRAAFDASAFSKLEEISFYADEAKTILLASTQYPDHTHADTLDFLAWSAPDSLPAAEGNYCLQTDVVLSAPWTVENAVNLCLNGYKIDLNGKSIQVGSGGSLSIDDCSQKQYYVNFGTDTETIEFAQTNHEGWKSLPAYGGVIHGGGPEALCVEGGSLTLRGGNFSGNVQGKEEGTNGQLVARSGGSVTISGGSVSYNRGSGYAAVTVVAGSSMVMDGGIVSCNSGGNGGGILAAGESSAATITGGEISGNTADHGGGICVIGGAQLALGGTVLIQKNSADSGGGVYVQAAAETQSSLHLSGNAQITENVVEDGNGNLYLDGIETVQAPLVALDMDYQPAIASGVGTSRQDGVFAQFDQAGATMESAAKRRHLFQPDVPGQYVYAIALTESVGLQLSNQPAAEVLDADGMPQGFGTVEEAVAFAQNKSLPEVSILRSMPVTNTMEISQKLLLRGAADVQLQAMTEGALVKAVQGADLELKGLTILGGSAEGEIAPGTESGDYLILVGTGAKVCLDQDTALQNASYGGVRVDGGELIHQGTIFNCAAPANGGGIQLNGGVLDLDGGSVYNCVSARQGGGIYADVNSEVKVSGTARVEENWEGSEKKDSNLFLETTLNTDGTVIDTARLVQSGHLVSGAHVSLRFSQDPREGQIFASFDQGGYQGLEYFFCDQEPNFAAQAGEDQTLVWSVKLPELAPAGITRVDIPVLLLLSVLFALAGGWLSGRKCR